MMKKKTDKDQPMFDIEVCGPLSTRTELSEPMPADVAKEVNAHRRSVGGDMAALGKVGMLADRSEVDQDLSTDEAYRSVAAERDVCRQRLFVLDGNEMRIKASRFKRACARVQSQLAYMDLQMKKRLEEIESEFREVAEVYRTAVEEREKLADRLIETSKFLVNRRVQVSRERMQRKIDELARLGRHPSAKTSEAATGSVAEKREPQGGAD